MIRSHVRLIATIPIDVADRVIETWARTLQAEASDIYAKIVARIPDKKRYIERIAQPSHDGFAPFVNPSFTNKSGQDASEIQAAQASNIKRSYEKYKQKLEHLFETVDGITAKRFKELVEKMKSVFGSGIAARTLPFTGTKIEGRGCATIAGYWLTNDRTVLDMLRAGDVVLQGNPYLITKLVKISAFKAALMQRLTQAGSAIVKANYDAMVIASQNTRTNEIIQGFIDPALGLDPFTTGGLSHVDYIQIDKQLFLDVQVSQV